MMRVLIADDEAPARAKLARWLAEEPDVHVVGEAANGLEAAQQIATHKPAVVLLDIQMPGLSGLDLAAQLDGTDAPLLVFVTAYDEFAVKAFELDAIDYLLKPYDKERLLQTLDRVRSRLASVTVRSEAVQTARRIQRAQGYVKRLLVPAGEALEVLDTAAIQWLEADDNYVHLHAGVRRYTLRRTLQDLLDQLDSRQFVRIHKSSAVNILSIQSLEPLFKGDYELTLRGGHTLRMSRRYTHVVLALLGNK